MLAEYTTFWHHPNGKCYGQAGWVPNPPEDLDSGGNGSAPAAGSADPTDGSFGAAPEGVTVTNVATTINGNTTTIVVSYSDNKQTTTVITANGDGTEQVVVDRPRRHGDHRYAHVGRFAGPRARGDPAGLAAHQLARGDAAMKPGNPRPRAPRQAGVTLVELMVAVSIVAILASVAYPSYLEQVRKGRRAEAQAVLMEASQFLERFSTVNMRLPPEHRRHRGGAACRTDQGAEGRDEQVLRRFACRA